MIYKALIVLFFILQSVFTVIYLRAIKNEVSIRTLIIKIICSSIFVATGITSAIATGGFSSVYSKLMVIGFICSWAGDIMLHLNPKIPQIIIGGLGFLAAHALYIISFIKVKGIVTGEQSILTTADIIIIICLYALAALLYFTLKLKAGKLLIPIMIYALILCFMMSKAIALGIALVTASHMSGLLVIFGALLFVISDFTLGISFLGKPEYKKQVVNMATYFPAQMLLALSVYFLNTL